MKLFGAITAGACQRPIGSRDIVAEVAEWRLDRFRELLLRRGLTVLVRFVFTAVRVVRFRRSLGFCSKSSRLVRGG